jgi:hypothetical protein
MTASPRRRHAQRPTRIAVARVGLSHARTARVRPRNRCLAFFGGGILSLAPFAEHEPVRLRTRAFSASPNECWNENVPSGRRAAANGAHERPRRRDRQGQPGTIHQTGRSRRKNPNRERVTIDFVVLPNERGTDASLYLWCCCRLRRDCVAGIGADSESERIGASDRSECAELGYWNCRSAGRQKRAGGELVRSGSRHQRGQSLRAATRRCENPGQTRRQERCDGKALRLATEIALHPQVR